MRLSVRCDPARQGLYPSPADLPRRPNDRQLPTFNRTAFHVEMAGEIREPLRFNSLADREAISEIERRNRLVVERDSHGRGAPRAIVERDAIDDSIGASRA